MKNFDADLAAALAAETLSPVWLLALQLSTPVYYTDRDRAIRHDGKTFQPRAFKSADIASAISMSVERLTVTIDDADSVITALFLGENVRKKTAILYYGVIKTDCTILAEEVFRGFIGGWNAVEPDMEIRIVNEMVLWNQKTLRIAQSTCPWIFRGTECGYGGSASWCDQSYERCTALGNADRFGGFEFLPSIMERQVWWGRIPK